MSFGGDDSGDSNSGGCTSSDSASTSSDSSSGSPSGYGSDNSGSTSTSSTDSSSSDNNNCGSVNSDSGSNSDGSDASPSSSFGAVNDSSTDSSGSITGAQLDGSAGNSLNPSEGVVGGTPCSDDIGNYSNNNTYNGISLDGSTGSMLDSTASSTAYSFNGYTNDSYNSTAISLDQNTMDMSGFQNTEVSEPSLLESAWNSLTQWANENVVQPFQTALNTPIQVLESTSVADLLANNVPGMMNQEVENGLSAMGVTISTNETPTATTNMIGDEPEAIDNWAAASGITPVAVTTPDESVAVNTEETNRISGIQLDGSAGNVLNSDQAPNKTNEEDNGAWQFSVTPLGSPDNFIGTVSASTEVVANGLQSYATNSLSNMPRPNNIQARVWNNNITTQLTEFSVATEKLAKGAKYAGYAGVGIGVGVGVYDNIQQEAPTSKIVSDAVVDTAFGLGGLGTSILAGGISGSFAPGIGTAVGGLLGGSFYMATTEFAQPGGKSIKDRAKDAAYNAIK